MKNITPNPIELLPFSDILEPETAWRDVKGANKPDDNASNGARIGTNFWDSGNNLPTDGNILNESPNVNVTPQSDNTYNDGADNNRWKNVYGRCVDAKKDGGITNNCDLAKISNTAKGASMANTRSSILFSQSAHGTTIGIDATSGTKSAYSGNCSWSHTCSGTKRILIVVVSNKDNQTANGCSYNGIAMTRQVHVTKGSGSYYRGGNLQIYYLVNPDLGTHTVQVNGGNEQCCFATSLTGVNVDDPIDTSVQLRTAEISISH